MKEAEKEKLRQIISRTDKSGNEKLDLLVEIFEQSPERVSVNAVVSVQDLEELTKMLLEQHKVYELLDIDKHDLGLMKMVYYECCGYIQRLINGDKSVIKKAY